MPSDSDLTEPMILFGGLIFHQCPKFGFGGPTRRKTLTFACLPLLSKDLKLRSFTLVLGAGALIGVFGFRFKGLGLSDPSFLDLLRVKIPRAWSFRLRVPRFGSGLRGRVSRKFV